MSLALSETPKTGFLAAHICASISLYAHTEVSSSTGGLNFGLSLHLFLYFVYASREVADEIVHNMGLVATKPVF